MNKYRACFIIAYIVSTIQIMPLCALTINPSDDGSIYQNGGVSTGNYLTACEPIRGVMEFPTNRISFPVTEAYLSVNAYGTPLWDKTVEIYGYESSDGQLTFLDYDAGTFLGTLIIPDTTGYNEDFIFEVTTFMQGISSPYVGFNLRTDYGEADVFSSLEYNYGHSSQLLVSPVPEPSVITLFAPGLILLFAKMKK